MSLAKVLGGMVLAGGMAWGQKYEPPPPPLTTAPCVPTKKEPCTTKDVTPTGASTAEKFPFPGDAPSPASADKFPLPGEAGEHAKTETPSDSAKAHPFPGDTPEAPGSLPAETSSSSSEGAATPDGVADPPADDAAPKQPNRFARKHMAKVEDKDAREAQDIEVSRYYTEAGNYHAAYLRAKDAVGILPDDPEAHYVLAEAAAKMKNKDEARAEYKAYLRMEPDGKYVKGATAALKGLEQ